MNSQNLLLCIDLNQVDPAQRQNFSAAMEQENWEKHARIQNVWTGTFEKGVSSAVAVATAKSVVATCAQRAHVPSLEVLIHVGEGKPIEYSVRPEAALRRG